jgi:tetratricopeptide (TPR) repeat protein
MNRKPVVFLSSVFRGLKKYREQMYRIITQDFGWECNAYEFHSERYIGSTERACLKEVDGCDLYVGVFWKSAGSSMPHDNVYITELEYYRARKLRKPMMIYVVEADPEFVEANLALFIATIKEPDSGQIIQFCKNFSDLTSKFKSGLNYFGECWVKGETASWAPSFLMDNVLKDLGFLTEHPELYHLPRHSLAVTRLVDIAHLQHEIDAMRRHHERSEFYSAGEVGAELLLAFLNAGISFEKKELLPLWAEFLYMWAGTCTWLNILNMPYDAVWAARMLSEIYEAQAKWPSYYDTASLISHTLYVQSCATNDEKLSLGIAPTGKKRFQEERRAIFSIQIGLEKKRQHTLQKALDYDKLFVARSKPNYPYLYRAYIYQVMGNYDQAILDFERMAAYRRDSYSSNDISYIDILSDLGGTKVLKAINDKVTKTTKSELLKDGLHLLREAHEKAQMYSSSPRRLPFYVIIEKEYAKGLLFSGDKRTAESLLEKLHRIAIKEGLSQQAGSIGILLDKSRGLLR